MLNKDVLTNLMPHPYDMATEKQCSMLKGIAYPTALNTDVSWLTFGSQPKLTKEEASELIGLIQSKNLKKAASLAATLKARDAFLFHLEKHLKGGDK